VDLDVLYPYLSDPSEVEYPSRTRQAVHGASGFPRWSEGMGGELASTPLVD